MATTHDSLRYVRGVTSVHTSAGEAYTDGAGVCQDFADLALAFTKSVGLPSRDVSGYFHPDADAAIGEEITGESHAWVEVWPGAGGPTTPRTTVRWGSATSPSGAGATTATCRRSKALRGQRREHHAGGGPDGKGPLNMAIRTDGKRVVTAC